MREYDVNWQGGEEQEFMYAAYKLPCRGGVGGSRVAEVPRSTTPRSRNVRCVCGGTRHPCCPGIGTFAVPGYLSIVEPAPVRHGSKPDPMVTDDRALT